MCFSKPGNPHSLLIACFDILVLQEGGRGRQATNKELRCHIALVSCALVCKCILLHLYTLLCRHVNISTCSHVTTQTYLLALLHTTLKSTKIPTFHRPRFSCFVDVFVTVLSIDLYLFTVNKCNKYVTDLG